MAPKKWNRIKQLDNPLAIDQLENQYQFSLSAALKQCILANNGGRPKPNTIELKNGEENDVKMLLSYNKNDAENIYQVIEYFISSYHGTTIPFASDSAGNYYCEQGKRIILWTQSNEIFPVCNSFEQFLEKLYDVE